MKTERSNTRAITERIVNHPFFAGMEKEFLSIVISSASERVFARGEIIFREGKPASHFYLIESGRVGLEAHEPADGTFPVQELHAGEVLGWSWLVPPFVSHFQARALEQTRTIVLDGAHLLIAAEQNKQFGFDLLRRVTRTMVQRLEATRTRFIEGEKKCTQEMEGNGQATWSRFDPSNISISKAESARRSGKEKEQV